MGKLVIQSLRAKDDFVSVCELFNRNFDEFNAEWFASYLNESGLVPSCSFIGKNKCGDVVGACVVTKETIEEACEEPSETLIKKMPGFYGVISNMRYLCISVLAVDREYRGGQLNYELVGRCVDKLRSIGCEWVYVQVMHKLKTHDYWKRWGAVEFFENEESKHYALPITSKAKIIINNLNKKNMKRTITLNESQLRRIVKESVKRILKESDLSSIRDNRFTGHPDHIECMFNNACPQYWAKKHPEWTEEQCKKAAKICSWKQDLKQDEIRQKSREEYAIWKRYSPTTGMYWRVKHPDWSDEKCEWAALHNNISFRP